MLQKQKTSMKNNSEHITDEGFFHIFLEKKTFENHLGPYKCAHC